MDADAPDARRGIFSWARRKPQPISATSPPPTTPDVHGGGDDTGQPIQEPHSQRLQTQTTRNSPRGAQDQSDNPSPSTPHQMPHSSAPIHRPRSLASDTLNDPMRHTSLDESRPDRSMVSTNLTVSTKQRSHKRPAVEEPTDPHSSAESHPSKRPFTPPQQDLPLQNAPSVKPEPPMDSPSPLTISRHHHHQAGQGLPHQRPTQSSTTAAHSHVTDTSKHDITLFRQPETRPITEDQLVNEVKGIYAGLVMVEKKCIEICQQQAQKTNKLTNEQWQALIALHRTLLHEHHDFFSASQHPTASPALRRLATKYVMPARMWRHGIHAFLELLRHRLPESLDHMLAFVYLAYSMMALLMESVPSFVETWIECLGDLARYRMAIEEADLRDREIWSNVARMWYNKAADLSPNVGRIQHHLAVLARPNIVQQLFYYSKALVSVTPFINARESIMLLFSPLLESNAMMHPRYPVVEASLVTAAGILFVRGSVVDFQFQVNQFRMNLDGHLARSSSKFKVQGPEIASSLVAMLMDFGKSENLLWKLFTTHMDRMKELESEKNPPEDKPKSNTYVVTDLSLKRSIQKAHWDTIRTDTTVVRIQPEKLGVESTFTTSDDVVTYTGPLLRETISAIALRIGDKNIVPFMHVILASLVGMSYVPGALEHVEAQVPWDKIVMFLNTMGRSGVSYDSIESDSFPRSFGGTGRQLPEDFPMRGLIAMQHYFPPDFFEVDVVDEDERALELPSHQAPRAERCLWCGWNIASVTRGRYLTYDNETKQFAVAPFAESLASLGTQDNTFASRSHTLSVEDVSTNERSPHDDMIVDS